MSVPFTIQVRNNASNQELSHSAGAPQGPLLTERQQLASEWPETPRAPLRFCMSPVLSLPSQLLSHPVSVIFLPHCCSASKVFFPHFLPLPPHLTDGDVISPPPTPTPTPDPDVEPAPCTF